MNRKPLDSYFYRGDCGLPMGVLPTSPAFQAFIRWGYSPIESYNKCNDIVNSFWQRGYADDLAYFYRLCTEYSGSHNPFVSATTRLKTAVDYAQKYGGVEKQPYISIIKLGDSLRYDWFLEYYESDLAKSNSEIAIIGQIFQEEIIAQIPISSIPQTLMDQINQGVNSVDDLLRLENKQKTTFFKDIDDGNINCPHCKSTLSGSLANALGSNNNEIELFPQELYVNPYHPFKHNSILITLSIPEDRFSLPFHLRELVSYGQLAICKSCNSILHNPKLNNPPITIISWQCQGNGGTLKIANHNSTHVRFINIAYSIKVDNQIFNLVRRYDLVTGFGNYSFKRNTILANSIATFPFAIFNDYENSIPEFELLSADIFSCQFESGRLWINIETHIKKWDFNFNYLGT